MPALLDIREQLGEETHQYLKSLIVIGAVEPATDIRWSKFGCTLAPFLGAAFRRILEAADIHQKQVVRRFQVWKSKTTTFSPAKKSPQISLRLRDPLLEKDATAFRPWDVHQLSHAFKKLADDPKALGAALGSTFPGFPTHEDAAQAVQTCFAHLALGSKHSTDRLNRLGLASKFAREIAQVIAGMPLSQRSGEHPFDENNPQLGFDRLAHDMYQRDIKDSGDKYILSEENKHEWRIVENRSILVQDEEGEWKEVPPGAFVWLIDPADGSLLCERGLSFGSMIALGEVMGDGDSSHVEWFGSVVCLPESKELFLGLRPGGGLLIDYDKYTIAPLKSSGQANLRRSLVNTHISSQPKNQKLVDKFRDVSLPRLIKAAERTLMLGVGATMSHVASGKLDLYINVKSGGPWDYIAPAILVEAGGGCVCNFFKQPLSVQDRGIVAAASADLCENFFIQLDLDTYSEEDFVV